MSVFKRGTLSDFWTEYVGVAGETAKKNTVEFRRLHRRMWQYSENVHEDILFQKVYHLIEPKATAIPFPEPGESQIKLLEVEEFIP